MFNFRAFNCRWPLMLMRSKKLLIKNVRCTSIKIGVVMPNMGIPLKFALFKSKLIKPFPENTS